MTFAGRYTLRRRLVTQTAAVTLLVLLAFLIPLGLLLDRAAQQRAVSAATQRALMLAPRLADDPASTAEQAGTTVFLPNNQLIGTPAARTDAVELAALGRPVTVRTGHGVDVLVPAPRPDGTAVVRVAVSDRELHDGVRQTMLRLVLLGAALFTVALLVADRLARRLVSATTDLAGVADRLTGGDLTARAGAAGPAELQRIGRAINRLAVRIEELLDEQRHEAAALAHGLRTPLTALRLEAGSLGEPRLTDAVHRMTSAVDEVIRTARRPVREGLHPSADLAEVIRRRLEFWAPLAEETGRRIEAKLPGDPVPVRLSPDDAATLVDVLLDNVFTHTPATTRTVVSLAGSTLRIDDDGPGLAPAPGADGDDDGQDHEPGDSGSTGMGLAIAARIAGDAHGRLTLSRAEAMGGARVEIDFGPSPFTTEH